MIKPSVHIVIIEPSQIIYKGLVSIISESGRNIHIVRVADFMELQHLLAHHPQDLVILNPSQLQIDIKIFQTIRNRQPGVKWLGLVYSFFDQQLLSLFDGIIYINDLPFTINSAILQLIQLHKTQENESGQESLSDRETEVLHLLVTGLANKEIADKLNISIHTIITHRKNISQKTGIKSVSGLTIYAVVKGIISIENFTG